jgi:Ras family protein
MVKIIHEKIVDFTGVKEIPCVIVGAKVDVKNRLVISPAI